MNETRINVELRGVDGMTEHVEQLTRQVAWFQIQYAADPDGKLAETSAMLRLKRGCRR